MEPICFSRVAAPPNQQSGWDVGMASLSTLLPTRAPSLIFSVDDLTAKQHSQQPPPIIEYFDMVEMREDGGLPPMIEDLSHPVSRLDNE